MLKKMMVIMMIVVVVLTGSILVKTVSNSYVCGNVRTVDCVVVKQSNGIVTLKDEQNNLWLVTDDELTEGDVVSVQIDDGYTPEYLLDDTVIDYK